ncbi:Glycosyltransferase involved in cell wall bisynthesis [Chitinophaga sp. YR627]|uniref:glycosyltransferase n=1 Tax=Chitinophaga sp. YR627 TaxID=1881041 RepID=UPI0008E44967|nr:glycosyltransferase [Chitinophaga sp. YR627]SFN91866.1 Glycosyltransferase involved in cell wall bisynthesis [Chitinophaga sp. YR627]
MKKNVLVVGEAMDLYRTQAFVKCVLDRYQQFNLTYIAVQAPFKPSKGIIGKVINKAQRVIDKIFRDVFLAYQLILADLVYIPAMSVNTRVLKLAFLMKKKVLAEYYISLYDTYVLDRGLLKETDRAAIRYKAYDTLLQKHAHLIYLNPVEAARYSGLSGLKLSELEYSIIPLIARQRNFAELAFYKGAQPTFNIAWWGTYIPLHGLDKLLQVCHLLKERKVNFHFHIFGNDEARSLPHVNNIREYGLEDVVTLRNDISFSNNQLEPFLIKNCSLAMGAFGDSEKARAVILNKTIEAVGMKLPVLTQTSPAFLDYFEEGKSMFMCKPEVAIIADKIIEIIEMQAQEVIKVTENAYTIFERHFSERAAYSSYNMLLNQYQG